MPNNAIVLAGANRSLRPDARSASNPAAQNSGSEDDGYLTAKEAAQLQLVGTELVVLTACETAAGEQQSGEGLYGLQHALNLAGARTTLLSLWKVDDDATPYIMERYYRLLQQGKGRMEALLAVQNESVAAPRSPHGRSTAIGPPGSWWERRGRSRDCDGRRASDGSQEMLYR